MGLGLVGVAGRFFTRWLIIFAIAAGIFLAVFFAYYNWTPGLEITDGRHDLKTNAIWLQHGWLGDDQWFIKNRKKDKIKYFRNPDEIRKLVSLLRQNNITDVFPHLCPTSALGEIPSVDTEQAKLFLTTFDGLKVMPWVGGVLGVQAFPEKPEWRRNFAVSIRDLLAMHPQFSGVHINIEPLPSGNKDFLLLLDEVRKIMPQGKILSVAAFLPMTILQPFKEVRWNEDYYKEVSKRADQIVVMMYDTSIPLQKPYQYFMSKWVSEIPAWGKDSQILFGIPAYEDAGVGYHSPRVENIENAILGINAGLRQYKSLPLNYQGIAIYCEWEMNKDKWESLQKHFLKSAGQIEGEDNSITAAATVGGRIVPYGKSGTGPAMLLRAISDDKSYGYTASNPVKTGGASEHEGSEREVLFLNALYGPNGKPIEYQRLGSCCPFKIAGGPLWTGFLDVYSITYKGNGKPIKLYLNMYDYEEPMAPYGFEVGNGNEK